MASRQRGLNMAHSAALERRLAKLYTRLNRTALQLLRSRLPGVLAQNSPQALENLLEELTGALNEALPDEQIAATARRVAEAQDNTARNAFFAGLAVAAGVRILGSDSSKKPPPRVPKITSRGGKVLVPKLNFAPSILTNTFVDMNTRLISTLRAGVADGVRDAVVRAQQFGGTPEDLSKRLLTSWQRQGVPAQIPTRRLKQNGEPVMVSIEKHAKLIANDQLGTLNMQLARARQTAAGIDSFTWMPSTADNPREAHEKFYGEVFTWAEGAEGILPGEEINCQCTAQAVIDKEQILADGDFIEVSGDTFTARDIIPTNPGPGALL